jgi:hypothetical protein
MKNACPAERKRSLGGLRSAHQRTPNSPCMLGKMTIQATTLKILMDQLGESSNDEVVCNLAAWINTDARGEFLTVEISPDFAKRVAASNQRTLSERFGVSPTPQPVVTRLPDKYWTGNNGSTSSNDRSGNDTDYSKVCSP